MTDISALKENIDKLHTTELGAVRIRKNLRLTDVEPVSYCRKLIGLPDCRITRKGKNWYCEHSGIIITVNAYSYTIITAHLIRKDK